MSWKSLGDIAFYGCAGATLVFVVLYMLLAPWYRTQTGRNIMSVMGALALAFLYFAFVIHNGGVPHGFYPMRAFIFLFIFASVSWRIIILVRAQIAARKEKANVENVR